ncbi:glycosyltransferase [Roseibium litorale]|uniref:Glycosyltransferase n=1 Tax=Roseibium litorale TaxID=2803841 RepID=A0ABR9CQA2_9HYPH|nr:glycosyltransferase [Roseibium litorale]MBD8893046.1 glycosyltransferase [Roseibium litorale]
MITVIIPTLNSEKDLAHTLAALVPAAAEGVVKEVVIVDGGSADHTDQVADAAGCEWLAIPASRGERMTAGVNQSRRGEWLLFLSADSVLESGWHHEAQSFIERAERSGSGDRSAAAFMLRYDAFGLGPRVSEAFAMIRSRLLGMPYGNQGLLISRRFYSRIGGHRPLPEMEDLDLVKRIGARRLHSLRSAAISSGRQERDQGMVTNARRALARFVAGTFRLPTKLVLKLHG